MTADASGHRARAPVTRIGDQTAASAMRGLVETFVLCALQAASWIEAQHSFRRNIKKNEKVCRVCSVCGASMSRTPVCMVVGLLACTSRACTTDPTSGCCSQGGGSCPSCCLYAAVSQSGGGPVQCTCHGCPSTTTTRVDAACTASTCQEALSGETVVSSLSAMGCEVCVGTSTTCFASEDAKAACETVQSMVSSTEQCRFGSGGTAGGGTSGGSSQPCFPSDATAVLGNGTKTKLADVRPGDEVVARTLRGARTTGTVSRMSTARTDEDALFYRVTTEDGATLHVTGDHRLPTGGRCCDELVRARDVRPGDVLWRSGDFVTTDGDGAVVPAVVRSVYSNVLKRGLHSPVLTNGDLPVVDSFVTSFESVPVLYLVKYGLSWAEALVSMAATRDDGGKS